MHSAHLHPLKLVGVVVDMDADRPVRLEAGVVPYMLEEHLLRGDGAAGR